MPIIKYKEKIVHFAHIPKCAGTSIEQYLYSLNGVELAFIDGNFTQRQAHERWNRSSPQHIDGKSLARIFPLSFFDGFFAIVRDPISRVKSAYHFQQKRTKRISASTDIDQFIQNDLFQNHDQIGWLDNHFLPQSRFFYPNANYKIFKLEQKGPEKAKQYLDRTLFDNDLESKIKKVNTSSNKSDIDISNESLSIIHDIYDKDFMSFNYDKS